MSDSIKQTAKFRIIERHEECIVVSTTWILSSLYYYEELEENHKSGHRKYKTSEDLLDRMNHERGLMGLERLPVVDDTE